MNEIKEPEQLELTLKTAVAYILRAFNAEYDLKITTDVRDLWEENLMYIHPDSIIKTMKNWIKNEEKRPKISQFLSLARHYDEDCNDKNERLFDIIKGDKVQDTVKFIN